MSKRVGGWRVEGLAASENTRLVAPLTCLHTLIHADTATRNYSIMKHKRKHTGEKPFECNICGYRGAEKSTLDRHLTTHTGAKAFACKLCEYKAARKAHLVQVLMLLSCVLDSHDKACTSSRT
jgi:transcription elongation factor Elf1